MERLTKRNSLFFTDEMIKKYDVPGMPDNQVYWDAMDKLCSYEDAEEDGRMIILPCKPGDTVYLLRGGNYNHIERAEVVEIDFKKTPFGDKCCLVEPVGRRGCLFKYYDSDFGKTIFLTREAAEQEMLRKNGEPTRN